MSHTISFGFVAAWDSLTLTEDPSRTIRLSTTVRAALDGNAIYFEEISLIFVCITRTISEGKVSWWNIKKIIGFDLLLYLKRFWLYMHFKYSAGYHFKNAFSILQQASNPSGSLYKSYRYH